MSFERFIAGKFMPRDGKEGGFSGPLTTIAIVSIALGVLVMMMSVSILHGFQSNIADKVAGFGSHITISSYSAGNAYQENPVNIDSNLIEHLKSVPEVRHLQCYATKGGMVKTGEQIYGIMFRGLSANYDTAFFASNLVEGRLPVMVERTTNDVLISTTIASKLKLKVGDKIRTYFWQGDSYRSRAFTVCGIYNTDLTEFDELYVIGDLHHVQRLNDWGSNQAGGYELLVNNLDNLNNAASHVVQQLPYNLQMTTIVESHPALFSWLNLLETNIALILTIMCIVSAVAIVSALLIMIFEKSATIGLLKALGATTQSIKKIFIIKSAQLILWGIIIGDALALLLSFIQQKWQIIRIDPESYSMSHVPVEINILMYLIISIGTLVICLAALLIPAHYISKINPTKTMRTE